MSNDTPLSRPLPGWRLEHLSWQEAEPLLTPERVVVIPLGAAAKAHGPHLPLNTDALLAEALAEEVLMRLPVVVAPLINTSHYPAFVNYPGSISVSKVMAGRLVFETVSALARFGPTRFYVLNTGVSTEAPLATAQRSLKDVGIELRYASLDKALSVAEAEVCQQSVGSHADEGETSMMLALYPHLVRMERAVPELAPWEGGPFLRTFLEKHAGASGTVSVSGSWGDPTLATAEKGQALLSAWINTLVTDIETWPT